MQIICVSRGTFGGGKRFAERLATGLGYPHLSREELVDSATEAGIPVGRLEMAVVRRQPLGERLAVERDRYRAFVTATLCARALEESLVYDGRTGHLVLPGVTEALRLRVIQDPEQRTISTMERLGLAREKAQRYNAQVDEDRRRWVRTFYDVDWEDPHHYDMVVNLSRMDVRNAAAGILSLAQLPEFQITPATLKVIRDLRLAARCRLAIGAHSRTRDLDVKVRADGGRVWVTYLPRQRRLAGAIPEALGPVEGVDELLCTMATTNLLWIEERFDEGSEFLPQVLDIAGRWNAAVELVQLSGAGAPATATAEADAAEGMAAEEGEPVPDGGILDETAVGEPDGIDPGLMATHDRLITAGLAGGYRVVAGGARELIGGLGRSSSYSLVILGEVFRDKGEAPRKRLTRELVGTLSDSMRVPVIGAEDLKSQYLFGRAQVVKLLVSAAVAGLMVWLLFGHQAPVLRFLSREGTAHRILATALLVVFVPLFAYMYGGFTRMLLRLLRFE